MAKKAENPHGLTDLQLKFCLEYARSLNATDSYKKAGYKCANDAAFRASASNLLTNPNIRAYLSEILNLSEVTVISEIVKIALATITDAVTWDENGAHLIPSDQLNDRGKAAIKKVKIKKTRRVIPSRNDESQEVEETIETEVEMYDRLAALEKLMKKLSLYPKDSNVIELLQGMAQHNLLVPSQAQVISDNLATMEAQLKNLPAGVKQS